MNNQINRTKGTIKTIEFKVTFDLASNDYLLLNASKLREFIHLFDLQLHAPTFEEYRDVLSKNYGIHGNKQLKVMNVEISDAKDLSHNCCIHYEGMILPTEVRDEEVTECPECTGTNLNEDKTLCWDCNGRDMVDYAEYTEGMKEEQEGTKEGEYMKFKSCVHFPVL